MKEFLKSFKDEIGYFFDHFKVYIKWTLVAVVIGAVLGAVGAGFYYALYYAGYLRENYSFIIWLLPLIGLVIILLYKLLDKAPKDADNRGTNMALAAVNSDEDIPLRMTVLIFFTTALSHMFGASVGREGAALQMGASVGNAFAKVLKFKEADKKALIMTGMSAAFSALFGAPLTAAVFSMEVISVGVMYYGALVPCVVSALVALNVAKALGVQYSVYDISLVPDFTPLVGVKVIGLGLLCAVLSIVICVVLILSEKAAQTVFENEFVRIFVAGTVVALMTLAVGSEDYNGLGAAVILRAVAGKTVWYAFLVKLLFTSISLAGGYRGGEIVPCLFIGATFGCAVAPVLGLPAGLCAALGMIAVFCGVTNSPLASIIMGLELFNGKAIWMFGLIVAVSYMMSGYYGLYKSQVIIYSKYRHVYARRKAHR